MHKYLRAIGFSNFIDDDQVEAFLRNAVAEKYLTAKLAEKNGKWIEQYQLQVAPSMGLTVVGERDQRGNFRQQYYFPYLRSYDPAKADGCSVDRHTEKETYSGVLDDYRTGLALIFYLCNSVEYRTLLDRGAPFEMKETCLTGLSIEGKVILPIEKSEETEELTRRRDKEQNALIEAAREGDEDAIETLTETDMDLFTHANKRLEEEDLYTVVESTFMPAGVECDQYQILGEITAIRVKSNVYTHEKVVDLGIRCNDMVFHVCINEADLLGVPAIGRRFKGKIWMQGEIAFGVSA